MKTNYTKRLTDSAPTEIPWIEWHGGKCPLKDEEVEKWEYKFRQYPNEVTEIARKASSTPNEMVWTHDGSPGDITAYRVLKWKAECGLSQLRPIAEAGEVPEGCVRYYFSKYGDDLGVGTKARHLTDVLFADIRLPESDPLVAEHKALPEWKPQVGDVVTLKSGGPKMTVVKLADTEGGLLAFLCEWFSDSGEYDSGVIYLTSLQPA